MMDFDWISALAGGSVGSILTTVAGVLVGRHFIVRDRLYAEKREAYVGLLHALHAASNSPTPENIGDFRTWRARCDLFASKKVSERLDGFDIASAFSAEDAANTYPLVVSDMKDDLKRT